MKYGALMFCIFLQLGAMKESVPLICEQNAAISGRKLTPEQQLLQLIAKKMEAAGKFVVQKLPQVCADKTYYVVDQAVRTVLDARSGFVQELVAIEGIVDHYRNRSFLSDSHFLNVLGDIVFLYFRELINCNIQFKKYIQRIVVDRLTEELKWQIIIPSKFGRYFLNQAPSAEMKRGTLSDAEKKRNDTVVAACASALPQEIELFCFLTDSLLLGNEIVSLKKQTRQGKKT